MSDRAQPSERTEREHTLSELKAKSPAQWRKEISVLEEPVRSRVACIVWWDYFGGRKVSDRWPHLDEYVNVPYTPAPREAVTMALKKVGYSEKHAIRRAQHEGRDCRMAESVTGQRSAVFQPLNLA